jgi:hypothetical protein
VISAGPITIDPEKREARVHGDRLILTDDEFDLLAALAREPHREWTPTELVDHFLVKYPDPGWLVGPEAARREAHPRRHRARPSPH